MNKTVASAAIMAGALGTALTACANSHASQCRPAQVLRRGAGRQKRLRRRTRHDLRRHLQGGWPGQCVEICRGQFLRGNHDRRQWRGPEGLRQAARPQPAVVSGAVAARARRMQTIFEPACLPSALAKSPSRRAPGGASSRSISPTSCPAERIEGSASVEVHAENYMGAGGTPHAMLRELRERFALSVHGVGLSIGGEAPLDREHLSRLKALCRPLSARKLFRASRLVVAWRGLLQRSLPLPYTANDARAHRRPCRSGADGARAARCCWKIRPPMCSSRKATIPEIEFLRAIARRTGCGLLLDVNNVFVSATEPRHQPARLSRLPFRLRG